MARVTPLVAVFCRSPYNYDRELASDESGLNCQECVDPVTGEIVKTPSLTKQSFRDETDVNLIVKRFTVTGEIPQVTAPTFQSFGDIFDYQSALNAVIEARDSFMAMPAEVRARFGNDPQQFVEFCSDGSNRDEAVKMGLVMPVVVPPEAPPLKVEVVERPKSPVPPVEPPKQP